MAVILNLKCLLINRLNFIHSASLYVFLYPSFSTFLFINIHIQNSISYYAISLYSIFSPLFLIQDRTVHTRYGIWSHSEETDCET